VANILTLPENDEVLVVGTVYKDMKLKPSILDEYVKVCLWITGPLK
jgi:DNA polymerase delta subunit 2